jgi:hypothetical protein
MNKGLKIEKIDIEAIHVSEGRRVPTEAKVDILVGSMRQIGLRQAITVRHTPRGKRCYELVGWPAPIDWRRR